MEESYGQGWITPFHLDDRQAAWQAWSRAVESGGTYRIECRLRRADGSYRWFLMRGVPSRDAAGQIVKWFGTCTDIDDLKRAEQEARSARERLALAVKVGHSGTFEWDIRNNVNVWTPELEELYGLPPGTFGGRYEDWEALVLPEDLEQVRAFVEGSLKTGEFSSEWRIRRAGGDEIHWIVAHGKVSFDDDGRPLRMIGFSRDITERKEAEQEVLRLNQDLERRVAERTVQLERAAAELEKRNREVERVNRMKTDFLARSSHELRTPLNAIVGYSDLLSEQASGPLPPPYPRFVANIQEGARHLLAMVNDLLDLSRIEAGRLDLNLERFDVSAILDEVLSVITPLAEIKGISLENRIARDTAVVADRVRFKQILYNLMSNAVKFTPEEGRVWIESCDRRRDLHHLCGRYGDWDRPWRTGSDFRGIPPGGVHQKTGSGGYRAGPGDHPQTGPASRRRRSRRKRDRERAAGSWSRCRLRGNRSRREEWRPMRKVLVVDDNRLSRELIVDILRPLSLEVAEAPDGTTALAAARDMRPDLVLLDLAMPDMDGFAVLNALRRDPECARTPVVAVTANAMPGERSKALLAGFSDFLTKPLRSAELRQRVEAFLNGSPV